ncbi:MAG: hypothetical protein GXP01_08245 [Alphaproteobacteria bacterium]|nr:hypothetical protein [Alphaproteobacteria bacterium]
MATYFIGYHGGSRPASPEEGAAHMKRYQAWMAGLGDALVSPDTPLMQTKTVSSGGVADGDASRLIGFCTIKADSFDAAIKIAEACPFLEMDNSTIEVSEVMEMKRG